MDGAIDAAAAQQGFVGRVDDRIDRERDDIGVQNGYAMRVQIHFRHQNNPSGISVERTIMERPY